MSTGYRTGDQGFEHGLILWIARQFADPSQNEIGVFVLFGLLIQGNAVNDAE